MIAATGAKNGCGWFSSSVATSQARPAVTAVCTIRNQYERHRSTRLTTESRPRRAVRPLRSYARRVMARRVSTDPS